MTTTDTLAVSLLPEILAELKTAHPGIEVELTTSNLFLNLTRREADVAIRPADDPPQVLFGTAHLVGRLCRLRQARRADAAAALPLAELARHAMVAPDDSLSATAAARWIAAALPDAAIARARGFLRDNGGARREPGSALAALPCYLGDGSAHMVRVSSGRSRRCARACGC